MRWTLNCILLASIAVISASQPETQDDARNKRDLAFIKNLVAGKLFGSALEAESPKIVVSETDNYKLFRVPGFNKILVKATPKKTTGQPGDFEEPGDYIEPIEPVKTVTFTRPSDTVVEVTNSEAVIEGNPNIAIVNSYLGTATLNDTLFALQGVRNLLQSGVLEAQREASYPEVSYESGKIVVNRGDGPILIREGLHIPMMEEYRPVQVTRIPDMPIASKYSYKQVNRGGVMTYTAKDNKKVFVSEVHRPVPLPPVLTSRIQEILCVRPTPTTPIVVPPASVVVPSRPVVVPSAPVHVPVPVELAPPPIPVYNVPKVQFSSSPVKVVSSGFSYNQVHEPPVYLTPPPVQVAANVPTGYSYSQIHNDGSSTSYTGSGKVVERKGERPSIVIAEAARPAPLPVFLTNRIEKVAATAMAARLPSGIPHALYEGPVVYREPYPVVMEERPIIVYDQVKHVPHSRPIYREDVNIYLGKHRNQRPVDSSHSPSGYSYKTVHADGSVSTFSDSGVTDEGNKGFAKGGSMFYPAQFPATYNYQNVHQPQFVQEEVYIEPSSKHYSNVHDHGQSDHSRPNGYSYKTINGGGAQTTYSGSGHVEHQNVANALPIPMANLPNGMVPEVVGPGEFFEEEFVGGKKVMFAQPVLSQYVYKQINHNNPNEITVADMGPLPLNGDVNVKVGTMPPPVPQRLPVLPSVTPRGPNQYVYMPPADVKEPLPTKKPQVVKIGGSQSSHSFTHVTNDGVHTHKDGAAAFESARVSTTTPAPVVKVVKSSTRTSTSKTRTSSAPKFIKSPRVSTTPRTRTTAVATPAPTTNAHLSLSSNPIVVLPEEQTFSFKQDRADGSSITVVGNNEKLSVIEDNRTDDSRRGDIPSTSL